MALAVAAYLPALSNGFVWDDDAYVTSNRTLLDADGLLRIWTELGAVPQYYPLVHTTFWIEHRLWGLEPAGYHAVNVLLHGLAAVLLWQCLRWLGLPLAWLAAALFAVHPVHVESVAWITERKNVLSGVFYLGAAWAYLRTALDETPGDRVNLLAARAAGPLRVPRRAMYGLSTGLFVAAMLSKTTACTLPVVLLLVVLVKRLAAGRPSEGASPLPDLRGRMTRSEFVPLAIMTVLGAPLALVTVWMEKHHVGASGSEFALSGLDRMLIAGRAFWFYPAKLLWPVRLTFIYPRWQIDHGAVWQYAYPLAACAAIALLWKLRNRLGPWPLAAVLCYAITMMPALGFFDVYPFRYSFVADHFQYLGSIGIIALVVMAAARASASCGLNVRTSATVWGGMLLVVLGVLSWRQCSVYRDLASLWRDTLRKNPDCWMAYNNLGALLQSEGRVAEAERRYREAIRLHPDYAEGRTSLASLLIDQGRFDEARKQLDAVLTADPGFAPAYYNRALCRQAVDDWTGAIEAYRRACKLNPRYVAAHYNLGVAYLHRHDLAAAESEFRTVLDIDPTHVLAHNNLGTMCIEAGRIEEAIGHYRKAVEFAPDYAAGHRNLAIALTRKGELNEARLHFEASKRLSQ